MDFKPDTILALAGIVLSLVFAYVPWLKDWYENLDRVYKPLFMAGVLLVVTVGKLAYDCGSFACMGANWEAAFWGWIMALISNQTAYAVGVRCAQGKRAREDADLPVEYNGQ